MGRSPTLPCAAPPPSPPHTHLSTAVRRRRPSDNKPRPNQTTTKTKPAAQLGGMGFIHYNNAVDEQLAHVLKTKRHVPGYVVTPAVLPPSATVADVLQLRVRGDGVRGVFEAGWRRLWG